MPSDLSKRWDKEEKQLESGVVIIEKGSWFGKLKEKIKKLFSKK